MGLSSRTGLNLMGTAGDLLGHVDISQVQGARAALSRALASLGLTEGLYAGGAAAIGDLPSGTSYPAATLCLFDDSGEAWWFCTTTATAITFADASAASGALYAVIEQQSGVSPAAAEGGRSDVQFLAQDAGDAAPAHSLLLGTGAITGSAFTTYTPQTGRAFVPRQLVGVTSKLGPPAGSDFVVGDMVRDVAGALFRVSAVSPSLTWDQLVRGALGTLGAGATTPPVAGDFNTGAIRDGYLWRDRGLQSEWYYSSSLTKWLSATLFVHQYSGAVTFSATGNAARTPLPDLTYDYYTEKIRLFVLSAAPAPDSSNYWSVYIGARSLDGSSTLALTSNYDMNTSTSYGGDLTLSANRLIDGTTYGATALFIATKTGSPSNATVQGYNVSYRYVRR